MNAKITYTMDFSPDPFDKKAREQGQKCWVLWEKSTPQVGPETFKVVACFNSDTDARRFMGHVYAMGLDGKLVELPRDVRECFERGLRL